MNKAEKFPVPLTSNKVDGVVVPIPTSVELILVVPIIKSPASIVKSDK